MAKTMHMASEHLVRSYQRRLASPGGHDRVSVPRKSMHLRPKAAPDERGPRDKRTDHGTKTAEQRDR